MEPLALAGINICLVKAGFAAGTTTTTTIANNIQYLINGKFYAKNAASNAATPTTDAATGLAFKPIPKYKGSVFVFGLDTAGAIKVVQGEVVDLDPAGGFINAPEFPVVPDTICPYGYLVVSCDSTYVATTTGWLMGSHNTASVTGVTYAFVDIGALPNRPQTA